MGIEILRQKKSNSGENLYWIIFKNKSFWYGICPKGLIVEIISLRVFSFEIINLSSKNLIWFKIWIFFSSRNYNSVGQKCLLDLTTIRESMIKFMKISSEEFSICLVRPIPTEFFPFFFGKTFTSVFGHLASDRSFTRKRKFENLFFNF